LAIFSLTKLETDIVSHLLINADDHFLSEGPMTTLLVTDRNQNCVQQYNFTSGAYIKTLIPQGFGPAALVRPSGIAVDSNNNIYVASITRHAVLRYNSGGAPDPVQPFCDVGSGNAPYGLAFDSDGNLYVAIASSGQPGGSVRRFDTDGDLDDTWAAYNNQMTQPRGIAFDDETGDLYVAAFGSHRVIRFTSDGEYVRDYSPIVNPYDIVIENDDETGSTYLYVSATGVWVGGFQPQTPNNPVGGHVQIWDANKGFFQIFGGGGPMPFAGGLLFGPTGNLQNYLYVASAHGFCINKYDNFGQFGGVFASGGTGSVGGCGLANPDFMVALPGGSGSTTMSPAQRLDSLVDRPVPVTLNMRLDAPVTAGISGNASSLNQPIALRHSGDPSHPCSWYSQTLDLGSGVYAAWKFERTDSKTWTLVLQVIGSVLVTYRATSHSERDASLPVQLNFVGANGRHFENWPKTITVSPG
jgi:sugar lactone lactonase YvrE